MSVPASGAEPPVRVSACIISFNEEAHIRQCLESVSWCDEMVVVDSFSQDATCRIAEELGARVVQAAWPGHVAQKNRAVEEARGEWILSLDCDERVTPALREELERRLEADPSEDGFYISRKLHYAGRWLEHGGWFPEWRLRLFRRDRGRWTGVDPHDTVEVPGRTARIPAEGQGEEAAVILHHSFRDFSHQLQVLDRYTGIQSGELFRRGRRSRLLDLVGRPVWRFLWTYFLRGGFLDGLAGFHMAVNHSYAAYMKYARIWEFQEGLCEVPRKETLQPAPRAPESDGEAS